MLADTDPRHLFELMALYRLEPWGDDWYQAARIEAAVINTVASEPVHASELVPNIDNLRQQGAEPEAADLHAALRARAGL